MYKLFGYVNEVEYHNKSRQCNFALDKLWVTKFGRLRLCTTFTMGMTITKLWKLFRYGVKRDHYEKLISIREFLDQLNLDFFNNPFSTYTGTLENNTPPLDKLDEGETFSNCRELHFPS